MTRTVLAAFVICVTGLACSKSPESPSPLVQTKTLGQSSTWAVSGTVYETVAGARVPVGGAKLDVLLDSSGTFLQTDAQGQYTVSGVRDGSSVLLIAYGPPGSAGFFRHQPCVSYAVLNRDTVLDVEYNNMHVPGTRGGPFVSGTVFRTTSAGREPVATRELRYYVRNRYAAFTFTDAAGRYEFCSVPSEPGEVWVTNPEDYDLGLPVAKQTVTVSGGNLVVDFDLAK